MSEMTNFEKAVAVRRHLANKAGEVVCYPSWGDKFSGEEVRRAGGRLVEQIGPISVADFTSEQCDLLDFGRWSDDDPIRLLPVWMHSHLAEGDVLKSISGSTSIVTSDYKHIGTPDYIDNDNRFGCLAYGIYPKGEVQ